MNALLKTKDSRSTFAVAAVILLALLTGAAVPIYVDLMGGQLSKLTAFPALLVLAFLLLYDRKLTLMLIILFRSSGDIFLESTRFSVGGYEIGVGGLINAFVILVSLLLVIEKPSNFPRHVTPMWIAFLAVALYGVAFSPVKSEAIRTWLSLVSYFMVFISAFHVVQTKQDFRFCIKLVLWSSALPVIYAFFDIAMNGSHAGIDGFRLRSTFSHANIFAFYLTLVIAIAFYIFKSPQKDGNARTQLLLGAYQLLLLGLLLLTKTRSAWLGCILCFLLYGIFFERRYLIYLLTASVIGLFIPGVFDRIADLGQGNEVINYSQLNSFAWRRQLWESALQWTQPADYLMGHGLQSFKEYSPTFFPLAGHINWGAHSVYVQWLFELGIVGIISFIGLYYVAIRELKLLLQFDRLGSFVLIVVLVNYLIYSFSDNMFDYLSFNWYLWFIVGAGCALARANMTMSATYDCSAKHLTTNLNTGLGR